MKDNMIKPKGIELYLIYSCPKCGCEWTKTRKEVQLIGKFICGGCNKLIELEPITKVRVRSFYKKSERKTKKPEKLVLTKLQEDAIMALTSLGFPKRQSQEFVETHDFQTLEDYIQGAVRKGTE